MNRIISLSILIFLIVSITSCFEGRSTMEVIEMHKKAQQACLDKGGIPLMDPKVPARMETCILPDSYCKDYCEKQKILQEINKNDLSIR